MCLSSVEQILREVPADEVANTAVAVSHSGRVIFTGTSSGTIRAVKYPLPVQKEWLTYQAHCGPVTKVRLNVVSPRVGHDLLCQSVY